MGPEEIGLLLGQEAGTTELRQRAISEFLAERNRQRAAQAAQAQEAQRIKEASAAAIAKVKAAEFKSEEDRKAAERIAQRQIALKGIPQAETPEQTAERIARTAKLQAELGQVGKEKPMSEADAQRIAIAQERLDLSKQKSATDQALDIADMERTIAEDPTAPEVVPYMDHVNQTADRAYYYSHKPVTDPWFGAPTTQGEKIPLPKNKSGRQITMAMVRKAAADNNTTVEEILRAYGVLEGE